jgi:hypothetical protein
MSRTCVAGGLALAALPALVSLACTQPRPWDQPHAGWQAVSSQHFVLYTESWFLTYRYVLDRLEDSHDAIARLFFSGAEADRVEVLLLSGGDYEALLNNTRDGVFVTPSPAAGGLVIMRAVGLRQRLDATAVHELVHRLIAAKHPSMPPWLNEGIATYLQTLKVDDDELEVDYLKRLCRAASQTD